MAKITDFNTLRDAFNTETNRIAAKIDADAAKLEAGGLTDTEEAAVLADFGSIADRLRTIGASATDPIPPVEETPPV